MFSEGRSLFQGIGLRNTGIVPSPWNEKVVSGHFQAQSPPWVLCESPQGVVLKLSGGQHASPQKFEAGAAIHGALQQLEPVNLSFDLALAPGELECRQVRNPSTEFSDQAPGTIAIIQLPREPQFQQPKTDLPCRGTPGPHCLRMADQLGLIYQDSKFAALFPARGQPAEAPARLALITVLQFVEGLSDRQAADAVRGRIDWKYLLGLELTDPGFNFSVLSEFRARLIPGEADLWLLDGLLTRLESLDLIKRRGRQRTDSTHVLAAVRGLNRLERVGETLRAALNSLAVVAPDWLQAQAPKAWYERYSHRVKNSQDRGGSPGTGGGHRGRWGATSASRGGGH